MGGGVGLIDFDGDGWLDVYCVQGGKFPGGSDSPGGGDRLFRNRGDATFEDATDRAGLATTRRGFGHGVTVGDYDNDGHPDLFVTRYGSYALYRNKGDGTFEDATEPRRAGGRPGLADLGGLRRPRRRRRPRPVRLPVPPVGPRDLGPLPRPRTPGGSPLLRPPGLRVRARSPLPERRRPLRRRLGRGRDRRQGRPGAGRRPGRPRRRRPARHLRRQRHDGELPLPEPRRAPVRGGRPGLGRRGQRRRGLSGRDGGRRRGRRRRWSARPGRDQLLRRVDLPLPEPRRLLVRRPDRRPRA